MNAQISEEDLLKRLESFVVDNKDLDLLARLANQFNIFEAIGVEQQELRHSDFLSYLLDPNANHELGDVFAKKLFQKGVSGIDRSSLPLTPIDIDIWNLKASEVFREWHDIDILFVNEANELVVAIENKIWTGEHSDQFQVACENQPPFKPQAKVLGKQWNEIYGRKLLDAKQLETLDEEEMQNKIREQWEEFLRVDMPVLSKKIGGTKGLFE